VTTERPKAPTVLPGAIPIQFELTFPGSRIELPFLRIGGVRQTENQLARDMLHLVGDKLIEAAVALGYKRAMPDSHDGYVVQASTAFGDMFVAALHTAQRSMRELSGIEGLTGAVQQAVSNLDAVYPALKGVRDSAAHVEEPAQGKARKNPITPQMQTLRLGSGSVTLPGNVRTVHHHGDESFGHGGVDGLIELVSMKESDFRKAVGIVQGLVDAFPWAGHSEVIPRRHFRA